jgi:hypothetical protein
LGINYQLFDILARAGLFLKNHTNLVLVLDFLKLSYDLNLGEFFLKQRTWEKLGIFFPSVNLINVFYFLENLWKISLSQFFFKP